MSAKPKTAYDVRRYLTLVQILAIDDTVKRERAIMHIGKQWGVQWNSVYDRNPDYYITELAKHVIEYHRKQDTTS